MSKLLVGTIICIAILGCTQSAQDTGAAPAAGKGCGPGEALPGATYDVSKSRFAFGSPPSQEQDSTMTRWIGSDGVVGIESCGSEQGIMNAAYLLT